MLDGVSGIVRYMTMLSARQRLVASNLANVDTPGYTTKDLDFQAEFQSLAGGTAPTPREVAGLTVKTDGNNVSLDRETRLLAENALRFNIAANLVRAEVRTVRSAIQEGRNG